MNNSLLSWTKATLQKLSLKPDLKHKGQHFLVDKNLGKFLISQLPELPIIEIGSGLGAITGFLVQRNLPVVAVEIDRRFEPILAPLQEKYSNLKVIFANVLKVDFSQIEKEFKFKNKVWLTGNLPYQLVEPLLLKLVRNPKEREVIAGATFLISERSAREMGKLKPPRGKLGILATSLFNFQLIKVGIGKENFWPPSRTSSAIVKLTKLKPKELYSSPSRFLWYRLFTHPRSKVKNSLREGLVILFQTTKNQARAIIKKLGLSENLLEKTVEQLNGNQLEELDKAIFKVSNNQKSFPLCSLSSSEKKFSVLISSLFSLIILLFLTDSLRWLFE